SPALVTALPRPAPAPPAPNTPKPSSALPKLAAPAPARQVTTAFSPAPPKAHTRERQVLQPGEVNDLSRQEGLGLSWQPGNLYLYQIGRNVFGKRCLIQFDEKGIQLARYGSW